METTHWPKPLETRSDLDCPVRGAKPMFIQGVIATMRLRLITLVNRWLSPEPPPFYGWPDDSK
jgi:hypothetical protein